MKFAFLDESGDNGGMGSKYLVSTLVVTAKKKKLVEIIVDMKKRMLESKRSRKWLNRNGGEIKFHNFPDQNLLERSIRRLSDMEIDIYSFIIDKKGMSIDPSIKRSVLKLFLADPRNEDIGRGVFKITADLNYFGKRKKRYLFEAHEINFHFGENNLHILEEIDNVKSIDRIFISVEQLNSRLSEELQATDLITGCIFQKYENGNASLYEILENGRSRIIVKEKKLS